MKGTNIKTNKNILLSIICFLLVLSAIPGLLNRQKGKNIKSVQSALLNTKYVNRVNKIEVRIQDEMQIIFKKIDEKWVGQCGDLCFLADEKVLSQMIKSFSKTRNFTEVSKNISSWKSYGLSEQDAFNIAFFGEDSSGNKTEFSSIFFGNENSDRTMIYLRNNRKADVFMIQNDLYGYFSEKCENYANMNLLPITSFQMQSIDKLEIIDVENALHKIYKAGDDKFEEYLNKIISLRGSALLHENILADENFLLCKSIYATTMNNEVFSIQIFCKNEDENQIFIVKTTTQNNNIKLNSVMEVSSWTFSRFEY